MRIVRIISASLLAISLFAPSAYAAGQHKGGKSERGGDIAYILASKELGLTPEQRGRLETIKAEFDKEKVLIQAELKVKRMELEELFKRYDVTSGEVSAKVEEMSALNGKLLMKANMLRLEARKVLTRDQFVKAKEIIEERRER